MPPLQVKLFLLFLSIVRRHLSLFVSVQASNKSAANSPVKPSAPVGPARMVLDVPDEPARGRKPVLRDELTAVVAKQRYPRERLPLFLFLNRLPFDSTPCGENVDLGLHNRFHERQVKRAPFVFRTKCIQKIENRSLTVSIGEFR
jgi:hypothetical protein